MSENLDDKIVAMSKEFHEIYKGLQKIEFGPPPTDYVGPIIPRKFTKWRQLDHNKSWYQGEINSTD